MIRVLVELWPFGDESRKRSIGEMKIWNDGTGDRKTGNYGFSWWRLAKGSGKKCKEHRGAVTDFPRLRLNVFDLIKRCLNATEWREGHVCQHRLKREHQKCAHGCFWGATCEWCIKSCVGCWDAYDSSATFCPRPGPSRPPADGRAR